MRNSVDPSFPMSVIIFVSLLLLLFQLVLAADYVPTEKILLNCGEKSELTDNDNRKWTPDFGSKFLVGTGNSVISRAATQDPAVPEVPYLTARVFRSNFTYSFPVVAGRKFVRLYFYANSYDDRNSSNALFSVTSGSYTLLKNFSAAQTSEAMNYAFIVKEYSINVDGDRLNLTFSLGSTPSNAYAFVNGIEVLSMPDIYSNTDGITIVGQNSQFTIDNSTTLENIYRLNVGGNDISPSGDTALPFWGCTWSFRSCGSECDNRLWYHKMCTPLLDPWGQMLNVDSGFSYLVRLHFCEFTDNITKVNQRVFDVFLNNQTAEQGVDVIALADAVDVPVFRDYVVIVPGGNSQQDLWLALHPDPSSKPQYYDALLNGVEIFKISDPKSNLAGPNPTPGPKQNVVNPSLALPSSQGHLKNQKAIIAGGGQWWTGSSSCSAKTNTTGSYASSLPSNLCRHFSFAEIKSATNNFDEALVLGVGGFGKVYKGEIDGGTTKVAIKRGNPLSEQGVHEFQTEIEMLSKLRHRHLVSLIGYCEENCEMILVYDYMAHGTLREHLYKTKKPPLPWKQRLEICIGAARGLHYLHTGAKHTIIHRDVKTTNILLDEKWVAKVSDFGLSKTGPTLDHTHVSTVVKGSFGYLDPEYFRRQQLTDKSDVYSFGVVLFEILCARPALNPTLPKEQVSLAEWAAHCHKKGILDQIMDPYLKGKITPECFKKFAETAMKCVADEGIERPSMGDVLWNLEFALQLQESAEESGKGIGEMDMEEGSYEGTCKGKKDPNASLGFDGNITDSRSSGMSMSIGGRSLASEDSEGLTPSAVFSQIMNPKGR
ncbi:hypothetical protein GOBAR_DD00397 [Gossypium barbadense]|nr:hypothetical protein GOBAR_DD00397 [Gossypium barbadense]